MASVEYINMTLKGEKQGPHTEEWKRMISERFKGRKPTYIITDEIKQKISESLKGRFVGDKNGNFGEKSPQWVGDNIGYHGIHTWMRRNLPKVNSCQICNKIKPLDVACTTGIYNRDFKNWEWQCRKCHIVDDGRSITFRPINRNNKHDPKTGRFIR